MAATVFIKCFVCILLIYICQGKSEKLRKLFVMLAFTSSNWNPIKIIGRRAGNSFRKNRWNRVHVCVYVWAFELGHVNNQWIGSPWILPDLLFIISSDRLLICLIPKHEGDL